MSISPRNSPAKIALLSVLSILGIGLTYYEVRGVFSPVVGTILPFAYLGILFFFIRSRDVLRREENHVLHTGRSRAADIIKSAGCMAAAVAWIAGAVRFVSDTPVGATVLLVPFFGILGIGVFFFVERYFPLAELTLLPQGILDKFTNCLWSTI